MSDTAVKHKILIVDDEEDVHQITEIVLKSLSYRDQEVELLRAYSGTEALSTIRATPDIAVILLDVMMESSNAGLTACRRIREEFGNRFVRILLRTGQPGTAPEERVVQEFDIDGYLPKAELTSTRLRTMVRTSLKAYVELTGLESSRKSLESLHESVKDIPDTTAWSSFGTRVDIGGESR
jgi:CheY-like chemotaxis protein